MVSAPFGSFVYQSPSGPKRYPCTRITSRPQKGRLQSSAQGVTPSFAVAHVSGAGGPPGQVTGPVTSLAVEFFPDVELPPQKAGAGGGGILSGSITGSGL